MNLKRQLLVSCILILNSVAKEDALKIFNTSEIVTESAVFNDRLSRAGNHILLDANYSLVSDTLFYNTPLFSGGELWTKHPLNNITYYPETIGLKSEKFIFEGNLGSEVGDPHFQEITGAKYQNRTPFTQGLLYYAPIENFSIYVSGDQNDHFSYTNVGTRSDLTSNTKQSWFSENLPPKSLLSAGFYLNMPNYSIDFSADKGWQWTTSPYSGFSYPWKGYQTHTQINFFKFFRLTYTSKKWNSISKWDKEGFWETEEWLPEMVVIRKKKKFHYQVKSYSGITTQKINMEKKESAPAYLPNLENTNRKFYRSGINISLENFLKDSVLLTSINTQIEILDTDPMMHLEMSLTQRPKSGTLKQSLFFYNWNPIESPAIAHEFWRMNSSQLFQYQSKSHSRGAGGILSYKTSGITRFGITLGAAGEWGMPLFITDSVVSAARQLYRMGALQSRTKPVVSVFPGFEIEKQLNRWIWFGWDMTIRKYFENEGEELEFLPSQLQSYFKIKINSPSNLQVHFISGYLSEKKIRGWTEDSHDFIVPAHWETNLSLVQSLIRNKIKLHFTALHLLGKEVLEHPNGNPLRFRIIVGGRASF